MKFTIMADVVDSSVVEPWPPVVVPLVPLEPLDGGVQSGGGVHVPFSGFEPFSPFGPFSPFWQ